MPMVTMTFTPTDSMWRAANELYSSMLWGVEAEDMDGVRISREAFHNMARSSSEVSYRFHASTEENARYSIDRQVNGFEKLGVTLTAEVVPSEFDRPHADASETEFLQAIKLARSPSGEMVRLGKQIERILEKAALQAIEDGNIGRIGRIGSMLPNGSLRSRIDEILRQENAVLAAEDQIAHVDVSMFRAMVVTPYVDRVPFEKAYGTPLSAEEIRASGHATVSARIIANSPMRDVRGETLLSYMHARFGEPTGSPDGVDTVFGSWLLTMPHHSAFLLVRPSLRGAEHSFQIHVVDRPDASAYDGEQQRSIYRAFGEALGDLLRPVSIENMSYNAFGVMPARAFARGSSNEIEKEADGGAPSR